MLKTIALLFIAAALPAAAPSVPLDFHIWKAGEIQAKGNALTSKANADAYKVASDVLGTIGNREFMIAHREGSGQVEWHRKQADILMITSGAVTLVYGGTIVHPRNTTPDEIRGPSIEGGKEVELGPGDVLHIPPQTPHLMKVSPGKNVTYFVVKVMAK